MKNLAIVILSVAFLFSGLAISAQEESSVADTEEVTLDEEVLSEDLGVNEPTLLPDSPFYFLKNWGRAIQSTFTFNTVKKAELREKFANEKLIEVRKMIELGRESEAVQKGIQNYREEIQSAKEATEKIRERAEENEQVGTFLDKFIQQQTLHQRILQNLEEQVPEEVFEKIKEAREEHLEKFGEVMSRLEEDPEQMRERLEENLRDVKGSEFKEFKNIEILKELEERVPEEARESIRGAINNTLNRLGTTIEGITPEAMEKFKTYTETISGDKEKQLEILESLKERVINNQNITNILERAKTEITERETIRTESLERKRLEEGNAPEDAAQNRIREEEKERMQQQEINFDEAGDMIQKNIIEPLKKLLPGQSLNETESNETGQNKTGAAEQEQMQPTGQAAPQQ
jgi:hypothetical protein